ncbi:hypothetical protein GOODEAATRI_000964, partial [Goodea atripinnis]
VKDIMKDIMSNLQQTNSEKILLSWVRQCTRSYPDVNVLNFTTSWSDGLALNAILHHFRPDAFSWDQVVKMSPVERLDHAFTFAKNQLAIERLLDPEDVAVQLPDKKSIIMYVTSLFAVLPRDVSMEAIREVETLPRKYKVGAEDTQPGLSMQKEEAGSSLWPENPSTLTETEGEMEGSLLDVDLDTYQTSLEEVLTWLLSAEDTLHSQDEVSDDVEEVKEQFHTHENDLEAEQVKVNSLTHMVVVVDENNGESATAALEEQLQSAEAGAKIEADTEELTHRWDNLVQKLEDCSFQVKGAQHAQLNNINSIFLINCACLVTALGPCLEQLSLEAGTLGTVPSLKDNMVVVSAHHSSTLQQLQNRGQEVNQVCALVIVADRTLCRGEVERAGEVHVEQVERWLDAVQELLSRDSTGLGDAQNLQAELNQCKLLSHQEHVTENQEKQLNLKKDLAEMQEWMAQVDEEFLMRDFEYKSPEDLEVSLEEMKRAKEDVLQKEVKVKILKDSINLLVSQTSHPAGGSGQELTSELDGVLVNYHKLCDRLKSKCHTLESNGEKQSNARTE